MAGIKLHIKWCGLCDAKRRLWSLGSHGLVSIASFRHISCDHVVYPDWLTKYHWL